MPVSHADQRDSSVTALQNMLRYAGLIMPFIVVALGIMVQQGILNRSPHYSNEVLIAVSAAFILLGIWQFFTDVRHIRLAITHIILYHVLAAVFLILVSGLSGPVVICWMVLMIATDLYSGRDAFALSALSLMAIWWLDIAFRPEVEVLYISSSLATVILITVASFVATRLRVVNDLERAAFQKSRRKEVLQRDRLLALVNEIGDAVISVDERGIIRIYNAAALNLLDTNDNLIGKSINNVLNVFDENNNPINITETLSEVKTNLARRDLAHKFDDGEMVDLYINIAPIRANYQEEPSQGYILVMRDITKEKSLEEERDEFISVVSHELRTPVAIAEGNISNAQMLMKKTVNTKMVTGALGAAHDQIMYLAKMINDLSTLSRAERGTADEPEEINVRQLLSDLYNEYQPQAESKGLKFNLDASAKLDSIYASRLYFEEVLQNLITNALKYTKEGSITLLAHQHGDTIDFAVTDTGIGISKTDLKKIFGKFYRSEDYRTRETTGTGLGLYVVSKLANKLKMHVDVKSRLNHGSTFSFTMPAKENQ
jgi:PAS domain S-box-containing protein